MATKPRPMGKVGIYPRGPDGSLLTPTNLPPADTKRWIIRRKAEVVCAVEGALLTVDQACERYNLSREEYSSWKESVERHGLAGLRTTRAQHYRQARAEA